MGFIGFVLKQKSAICHKIQLIDNIQNGLIYTGYFVGSLIFGFVRMQKKLGMVKSSENQVIRLDHIRDDESSRVTKTLP